MKKLQLLAFTVWIALTLPTAYAEDLLQQRLPEGAKMRLGRGELCGFQFSPDGTRLKVASSLGILHYDTQTGQEVTWVPWSENIHLKFAVFSPDGRVLASGHWYRTGVDLWDVETGVLLKTLIGHTDNVDTVAFSPDSRTLASGGSWEDPTVRLWDVETGTLLKTLPGHTRPVRSVAFSPDGRTLASVSEDIRLWDIGTGVLLKTLRPTAEIWSVAFSPDGRTLASGRVDIYLWDVETGVLLKTLTGHTNSVATVAFSPDGRTLASVSTDFKADWSADIRLWDVETGTLLKTLRQTGSVNRIAFSPDGGILASGSVDIRLWDIGMGVLLKTLTGPYTNSVWNMAFSPDGRTLASGSPDGTVHLWNIGTGVLLKTLRQSGNVRSVAFSPDGRTLASTSRDVRLWDVETGVLLKTFGYTGRVRSVVFSPDGRTLASTDVWWEDSIHLSAVRLWDVETGTLLKTFTEQAVAAFSPDGTTLASGGSDKVVRLWDARTGALRQALTGHEEYITDVLFSADGSLLASFGYGSVSSIRLWDARSGQHKQTISDLAGCAPRFAFSPDSGFLALIFGSQRILLWDIDGGETWEHLGDHSPASVLNAIAFSPDGTTVASGGLCGTVLLWDFTSYTSQSSEPDSQLGTDSITTVPEVPVSGDVARVSLSPASVWPGNVGDQVTVNANIAEGVDVRGYQVELAFDTAALRYVLSADGGYLPAGAFVMPPVVNGNRVTFGATSLQKSSEGDGTLAAFTFEVLTASPAMPTLSDVKLTDSNADFLAVQIELGEVTDSPQLAGDVNGDGVVDLLDMTAAAVLLSQTGENTADMNGDGVVDAVDLVLIAAAIEAAAAAPSLHPSVVIEMFTATEVRQWLSFARVEGLTGGRYQQGFLLLEQLLLILTPEETALLANYPNPFNPETWIPYQLSESADVTISIYAADGRLVRVLSLGHQGAGIYESRSRAGYWDGRNALGEPVASGVYFYTFTAGEFTATRKMLIRK